MRSMSSLGLGLSVVFGCLLLALVAELYYLFWWKKRFSNREVEDEDEGAYSSSPAMELLYMFCWRRPSSLTQSAFNPQQLCSAVRIKGPEANKGLLLKPFGEDGNGVESELMRLHNLSGPPRFLFTIVEETKEDMESEDGKGSRSRSLSGLLFTVETPFLTPLASPSLFTPLDSTCSSKSFNPLFESSSDAELCRVIRSSPPPRFKFLQDAEEKLHRMEDEAHTEAHQTANGVRTTGLKFLKDDEDESFITIIVDRNKERN